MKARNVISSWSPTTPISSDRPTTTSSHATPQEGPLTFAETPA